MAPKLKLVYFDIRGRGELIRLILKVAGVEFEDERVDFSDWPSRKPEAPDGQLPYLEIDGKKYSESLALARYLARKHSLAGKNDIEALMADNILCKVDDVRNAYVRIKFDSVLTEEQKKSLKETFATEKCPTLLSKLENNLSESKSGYLVGSNLTIADLAVVDVGDQMETDVPGVLDKYPKVTQHRQKVKGLPKLTTYFTERKVTPL